MSDAISERVIRTDIEMVVAARDAQIHLLFSEKNQQGDPVPAYTSNFLLSASDALAFSTLLADIAFEAETSLKPASSALKAELIERHRVKLVDRLQVVMNSQRDRKTVTNRQLAKKVLDIVFSEVFS